tara:strand:- start:392 stop:601 length:210 start_codon:yes stop_codon:yes gene_type:complete
MRSKNPDIEVLIFFFLLLPWFEVAVLNASEMQAHEPGSLKHSNFLKIRTIQETAHSHHTRTDKNMRNYG